MSEVRGDVLVPGQADGPVVAIEPLSFWGGFDPETGRVTDRSHPVCGLSLAGVVLVMRAGRGSSSSSSVLAEAIRRGTGPAGIVLAQPDAVISVGAQVAATLYGRSCPIVVVSAGDWPRIARWQRLAIDADAHAAVVSDASASEDIA